MAEGKFAEAERLYRRLAKEDDASPDAFVGLGSCCMERGDVAGAQEFYKRAREKGPNSLGVLIGLGSVYLVQSDYSNAVAEFDAALKVKESSAEAHYGLAFAQAKVGETGLARGHLDRFRSLRLAHPVSVILSSCWDRLRPNPALHRMRLRRIGELAVGHQASHYESTRFWNWPLRRTAPTHRNWGGRSPHNEGIAS